MLLQPHAMSLDVRYADLRAYQRIFEYENIRVSLLDFECFDILITNLTIQGGTLKVLYFDCLNLFRIFRVMAL